VLKDSGEAEIWCRMSSDRLQKRAHQGIGKSSVRGWIVSITYHASLDRWRHLSAGGSTAAVRSNLREALSWLPRRTLAKS